MKEKLLSFMVGPNPQAQKLYELIKTDMVNVSPEQADIIVVLGGDGFMLQALHQVQCLQKPVYGINCGTVGFLMNTLIQFADELIKKLLKAEITKLFPLKMIALTEKDERYELHAINEISLLRHTHQAAKICIYVNGIMRLQSLVGDGVIVATPAGSTAYNLSAYGPIIPLGAPLLALTPLSPFRPRHWRGALLPNTAHITFEILDSVHRSVNASADDQTIFGVKRIDLYQDNNVSYNLLFDPGHNLEDRILREQFIN